MYSAEIHHNGFRAVYILNHEAASWFAANGFTVVIIGWCP